MSKRDFQASRHDLVVNEQGVTIGSGGRKRALHSWDATWVVPEHLRREGQPAHLTASSSSSRAAAVAELEAKIDAFLRDGGSVS